MSITKTGIFNSQEYIESSNLNSFTSGAYTPTTGTNSCITGPKVNLSKWINSSNGIEVSIELDIAWTDFTGHSADGTFAIRFQGANYAIGATSGVWQGTNYICTALNNKQNLTTLINSSLTGGNYHYLVVSVIPASWLATYEGSNLGIRSDYSNGTGRITISNIKVTFGNGNAAIANSWATANNFYEY